MAERQKGLARGTLHELLGLWSAYRFAAARSLRRSFAVRRGPYPGVSRWIRHPSRERTRIHRVEAELIEQTSDRHLGPWIVPGDDQRAAILRASRQAIGGQGRGVDMVESLDDFRGRQMCLQELRGRRRLISSSGMWPSRSG